jgi:hypothetical protein
MRSFPPTRANELLEPETLTVWMRRLWLPAWVLEVLSFVGVIGALFIALTGHFVLAVAAGLAGCLFSQLATTARMLRPLSRDPEQCAEAVRLVEQSPAARAWRDQVLAEGRELLNADLERMEELSDVESACKQEEQANRFQWKTPAAEQALEHYHRRQKVFWVLVASSGLCALRFLWQSRIGIHAAANSFTAFDWALAAWSSLPGWAVIGAYQAFACMGKRPVFTTAALSLETTRLMEHPLGRKYLTQQLTEAGFIRELDLWAVEQLIEDSKCKELHGLG